MIDVTLFKTPQNKESAVNMVVNRFRELIQQQKLKQGDLLPSEGVLAENMGVSRGSIREAMKILSALGVVDIRRGDGSYVSGDIGQTLLDPFLLRLMMNDHVLRQMIQFREMIEFDVARAALKNITESSIALLKLAITKMEESINNNASPEVLAELDMLFHRAMGKATGNVLIEQLYEFVLKFFESSILQTYNIPHNAIQALSLHRGILNALETGCEEATLFAVEKSIREWATKEGQP